MTDIIGFSKYTINEKGEIYNKKKKIIMKQRLETTGYLRMALVRDDGIRKKMSVHRLLYQAFKLKTGEIMPEQIDHINNIKTDNSLENLRGCTNQENNRNRKISKNNKSTGYKDICKHKSSFQVQIAVGKGIRYYKTFKTFGEAIEHRDIKLKEFHGKFANNGNSIII